MTLSDEPQCTVAAAANIGIFSWTNIPGTYWLAKAMFYFSLSLSLWGVITSAQQQSVVRTLWARHDDQNQLHLKARVILRCPEKGHQTKQRRKSFAEINMLYVWQCPLMLMSYGWATLLVGLTLHVCSPLIPHSGNHERKVTVSTFQCTEKLLNKIQVAIFYLATGVALVLNFIWTSAWVCWTPTLKGDIEMATFRNSTYDISAPSTRSGMTWTTGTTFGIGGRDKLQIIQSKTI